MFVLDIDCPNEGLGRVMRNLKQYGISTDSRNGPVIRFPEPVCLQYHNPRRRVLNSPVRDANPFFHYFETMWMLAGLDTVAPLDIYNSGMKQYSDDGVKFAAPYGYRWRVKWGDQIKEAIYKLRANPEDRRIVIQMWDPKELFKREGKDFACNQQLLLDTRPVINYTGGYALDMTVTNRSNDLVYGAMGSNLVHFTLLHEFLALHSGLELGVFYQISKNMHLYTENPTSRHCWEHIEEIESGPRSPAPDCSLSEFGLTTEMGPLRAFVNRYEVMESEEESYLGKVIRPMCEAFRVYKLKALTGIVTPIEARIPFSLEILGSCKSDALRTACEEWFQRRLENSLAKKSTTLAGERMTMR
jgi:hypothetical protein